MITSPELAATARKAAKKAYWGYLELKGGNFTQAEFKELIQDRIARQTKEICCIPFFSKSRIAAIAALRQCEAHVDTAPTETLTVEDHRAIARIIAPQSQSVKKLLWGSTRDRIAMSCLLGKDNTLIDHTQHKYNERSRLIR